MSIGSTLAVGRALALSADAAAAYSHGQSAAG
jgi:hypothetical protein